MKVLAINASPRKNGNTSILLGKVLETISQEGIETKMIHIGNQNLHGCRCCRACQVKKNRQCIFDDDILNGFLEDIFQADAIILGTPSFFADMTSELKALIDRAGMVALANGGLLKHKIGAAVVAQRRAGAVSIQSTIHHMFLMSEMIIVGSNYWNMGFGREQGEVKEDIEGLKNMENLGQNIAWALKKLKA